MFIFVRHGESTANANGIIADSSHPLTNNGIEQARKTGYELKDKNVRLIVTSPYKRARQTAEIIASEIGINTEDIMVFDELRERGLGVLENNTKEHDGLWYFMDESSIGIETLRHLINRMDECLKKIDYLSKQGLILVIGHSISGFYLQQVAKGIKKVKEIESPALMSNADYVIGKN